jgi:uncharacterized membrane protein YfcA
MNLETWNVSLLAAVGFIGGLLGGILGIGGSIIFIPAMSQLLSVGQPGEFRVWSAVALICNVFVGAGGAFGHWRNHRIIPQVIKRIAPLGTVAAIVGVLAANVLDSRVLWLIFGAVVAYMACDSVLRLVRKKESAAIRSGDALGLINVGWPRVTAVATPAGLLAGLIGIGGGIFSVPSQQMLMNMPQKNAIANSSVTMIIFCAIAAAVRYATLELPQGVTQADPLILAAILVPPALVGAFLGGHLTHRLPDRLVRVVFIGFLLWTAYKSFIAEGDLPGLVRGWMN